MIDWQIFSSVLAALVAFRLLQAIPEFVDGVIRGYGDSRKERSARPETTAGRPDEGGFPPKVRR